ncbi:MAG: DMT family transporter [Fimbriimonadales bacterium]
MTTTCPAESHKRLSAEIGLVGVVLIWGANFSLTKATIAEIPPLVFTAARFAVASIILLVLLRLLEPGIKTPTKEFRTLALIGFIGNTIYQPGFILGLHNTTATNSAVIIGSLPGVVALLAWAFKIERVSRVTALGIGVGLAGVVLVVTAHGIGFGSATLLGDLLTIGAVLCWAAYTLGLRRVHRSVSPLRVTTITTAMGTPGLVAIGLPQAVDVDWAFVPPLAYVGLAYASLLSLILAYFLYNTGVARVGPSRASVFSCLIPLIGLAIAWVFLGEVPVPLQILGAVLVVGGVWMTRINASSPTPSTN